MLHRRMERRVWIVWSTRWAVRRKRMHMAIVFHSTRRIRWILSCWCGLVVAEETRRYLMQRAALGWFSRAVRRALTQWMSCGEPRSFELSLEPSRALLQAPRAIVLQPRCGV